MKSLRGGCREIGKALLSFWGKSVEINTRGKKRAEKRRVESRKRKSET